MTTAHDLSGSMDSIENKTSDADAALEKTGVGVLDKVIGVLSCFERTTAGELLPQDVAGRLDLPLATVYRLMQAMAQHRLLEAHGRHFRLGFRLASLGSKMIERIDIRQVARPFLQELGEKTSENANLTIRQDDVRVMIDQVPSSRNVRPFASIGEPLPLAIGAAGLALIAWLPTDQARSLASRSAARFGIEQGHPLLKHLGERCVEVRSHGYAVSNGERQPDVSAIAAPIRDSSGMVCAAVSLLLPTNRMEQADRVLLVSSVVSAATQISERLGSAS